LSIVPDTRGEITGPVGRGLYSRPVWRKAGKGTYVGGYMDFVFRDEENKNKKFDQIRLVPLIYADIAPKLRFATEIEFEHGGTNNNQNNGEIKVEFAILDYDLLGENLGFRGGILLTPLGKFNAIHDSPINDLTDRPIVNRFIIPTTLSESGAGFFGTTYVDPVKIDYELYAVNGFDGGPDGSVINALSGLRDARGSQKGNNNDKLSGVGRLGVSPLIGQEVGLSIYYGAYDDSGNNDLLILAGDFGFQTGRFEFLGEYANAQMERGAPINSSSVPARMQGFYGQLNVHFLQDKFRAGSTWTGVIRFDCSDTDVGNLVSTPTGSDKTRWTMGINYRPVEETVFKIDYQFNFEGGEHKAIVNDVFHLSFATYF